MISNLKIIKLVNKKKFAFIFKKAFVRKGKIVIIYMNLKHKSFNRINKKLSVFIT